ncbi:glycosyltransferase family 2 protein [Barnesiella intestinihominis]|uniref:glycosyltransferase family 2 protein n=1 Tax=Barnesiella intestinihominis TaxID=487174 RepID=UPI003970EE13
MQPNVSVIIPVYNIEKHLEKCLDSVIGQTLKDIEIIVVNDGSTDNSLDIITQYARKDSRIVIVDKPNEGLAYARKSGIEAAHGKYVQHLDGDDFLEPDACELLFKRAEETDADIVIMRFLIDSPRGQEEPPFWTQDEYNNISAIHTMAHEDYRWNLVFLFQRRDLHAVPIDYLQNLTYGEDAYQSIQIAYRSKKIVTLRDKPLYHYVIRESSVTQTGMTRQKAENVLLFPNLIETFLEGTPENRQFAEDIVYIRFRAYFLLLLKNWREGMTERCRFMAESLAKYPALEQLEEARRFTKLIRLYARCPWLGKLYTDYYVHKGKIKA